MVSRTGGNMQCVYCTVREARYRWPGVLLRHLLHQRLYIVKPTRRYSVPARMGWAHGGYSYSRPESRFCRVNNTIQEARHRWLGVLLRHLLHQRLYILKANKEIQCADLFGWAHGGYSYSRPRSIFVQVSDEVEMGSCSGCSLQSIRRTCCRSD